MVLQQQHLNTQRNFSPIQGSLLEHSIRLILRYNELISQCHLQPFFCYYSQTELCYIQGYSKENNHIDPISTSLRNPPHLSNSSSLCICILQVHSSVINFTDWILYRFLRGLFNFGKLWDRKAGSLLIFIIIILY